MWSGCLPSRSRPKTGVTQKNSATHLIEKKIAYPVVAQRCERVRDQLEALAQKAGVDLRQYYARLPQKLALQVGR